MGQKKRVEAVVREIPEGFTYDYDLEKYVCNWEYVGAGGTTTCGKTFVYEKAAVTHRKTKHVPEAAPVEEIIDAPVVGGDVVRAIVKDLQAGIINVPDLVLKLNGVAMALDMLHKQLAETDVRELQDKANKWDKIIAVIGRQPDWLV